MSKRHFVRWPFGYNGQDLDRGQVLTLAGLVNDEKLVRLGYVGELGLKAETFRCAVCGAEFVGTGERTGHGDKRHKMRDLTPYEEDERVGREERMLQEVAPLNLGNTAAVRG